MAESVPLAPKGTAKCTHSRCSSCEATCWSCSWPAGASPASSPADSVMPAARRGEVKSVIAAGSERAREGGAVKDGCGSLPSARAVR
eukprot:scaffold170877_cov33-Tisochrysis_lutea.AAC.1